jgi:hypothetical protein
MLEVTLTKLENPLVRAVVPVVVFAVFVFLVQLVFIDNSLLSKIVVTLVAAAIFTAITLWDIHRSARGDASASARTGWIDRALSMKRYRIR